MAMRFRAVCFCATIALELLGIMPAVAAPPLCEITVVEKGTGWPVPLVELRTTHNVTFVTDNAGVIAFDLPELMGRETWFDVRSPGYEMPADGFGYRGVRLVPAAGAQLKIEVNRTSIAQRVGRLTGAGLFAESQKVGKHLDFKESGVVGCDSTQNAIYNDSLYWVWGDTTLAKYPLGIFNASAGRTKANSLRDPAPPLKVSYDLFRDPKGVPRGVADIPGDGPTWLAGLVTLPEASGRTRLVANYVKVKPPLEAYESGLTVWDDEKTKFVPLRVIWRKSETNSVVPPVPDGHATLRTNGVAKQVLFGNPFPTLQCPATFEAWSSPEQWEALKPQASVKSAFDGREVKPHTGAIGYHPWRKRWVTVFMEARGTPSAFGELWYAEADDPLGPWGAAVKVLSHENYTFYNPKLHLEMSPAGSAFLFFEGTYTIQFSNAKTPTPRHDYNQILYRLDLRDARLSPAQKR